MLRASNYHTHTVFCDGKNLPEQYVHQAVAQQLDALGFSAHAPLPFDCNWTLPFDKYGEYKSQIRQLAGQFKNNIEIYCGVELDYIPDLQTRIMEMVRPEELDYYIGSIHFIDQYADGTRWCIDGPNDDFTKGWSEIFGRDSRAVIHKYFEYTRQMVRQLRPPVIGHLDKIKMQSRTGGLMDETDPFYRAEVMSTLEEIAATNCIVEINTRGVYKRNEAELYLSFWVLKEMQRMQIPVTINADAHRAGEVAMLFNETAEIIRQMGFTSIKKLINQQWQNCNL
jgi:histidinol-phosphatase (PHP family)